MWIDGKNNCFPAPNKNPVLCSSRKSPYSLHGMFLFCTPLPTGNSSLASCFAYKILAFKTPLPPGISNDLLWGGYGQHWWCHLDPGYLTHSLDKDCLVTLLLVVHTVLQSTCGPQFLIHYIIIFVPPDKRIAWLYPGHCFPLVHTGAQSFTDFYPRI